MPAARGVEASEGNAMATDLRNMGIDVLDGALWGTHFCHFYETAADLIEVLVPYFKAGLESNEFCMWICSEPLDTSQARKALKAAVPGLDGYLKKGQIEILAHDEWYVQDGAFDSQRVLDGWVEKLNSALVAGYDGLRLTGNTHWLESNDWEDFAAYEQQVNSVIGKYHMLAACSYALDRCGAAEILDVVTNHQFALIRRQGKWQRLENPDRRRAAEALRLHDEIAANMSEGVYLVRTSDGVIAYANPRFEELFGYEPGEMVGQHVSIVNAPTERNPEETAREITAFIAANGYWRGEVHNIKKDGTPFWCHASVSVLDHPEYGNVFVAVHTDVTERKQAEQALRRSEERYRDLVEGVDYLVTQVDREGRFIFVNHAARKVFGLEPRQCVGLSAFDFVHPDDRARTKEAFAGWIRDGRRSATFENRQIGPGGQVRDMLWTIALHFDDAGEVTAINSIAHDITDRKRAEARQRKLEERVQHAQKLESLGLLAGGIAHDFNNLLVSVLGNADLALSELPGGAPGRSCVEDIKKAAIRASELTGQMLAYSGRGRFLVGPVDLSELVRETGRLLEVSIPKSASLKYELADGLPVVEADAAQIHQVVMNLITNASEAIGEEGGSITVRTGVIDVGPEYLAATDLGEGLPEGPYVFLEVSDTGRGMDRRTRAKLFDPFFSTKFAGRGLGLAAVLGIVRGHKGTIRVYSEPGEGTTFKVLLPFSDRPADKADRPAPAPRDEWRGRGTVLIIDDEPAVCHVARVMLEKAGLTVMAAPDGQAGVELFRQHRDEIDAVLLDLTMPRMSGEETLRQLRRIREDVPVILTSGYDENHATRRFTSDRLAGFLQKPFELTALVGQFRRVMAPRPAGREEA